MKRNMRSVSVVALGFSLTAFFLLGGSARAAPAYYKGKTIRIMVPVSPGGTYDRMARLMAIHLPRHIPGKPTVIVQNRPGGGGLIGERFLYDSKPDGLIIGHFASGHCVKQFTGIAEKIDFTKYEWLGSVAGSCYMLYIRSELPYRSIDDLRNAPKPLKIGGIRKGSFVTDAALILKAMVGLNINVISGYGGYNPITLAIRQGELDGVATAVAVIGAHPLTKEMITTDFARVVLLMRGMEPGEEYRELVKNLPDAGDFIKDSEDLTAYKAYMGLYAVARPFTAPPGTNPQALEILRSSLWKTMNNEAFIAAAKKAGFTWGPTNHTVVAASIKSFLALPQAQKQRLLNAWK